MRGGDVTGDPFLFPSRIRILPDLAFVLQTTLLVSSCSICNNNKQRVRTPLLAVKIHVLKITLSKPLRSKKLDTSGKMKFCKISTCACCLFAQFVFSFIFLHALTVVLTQ